MRIHFSWLFLAAAVVASCKFPELPPLGEDGGRDHDAAPLDGATDDASSIDGATVDAAPGPFLLTVGSSENESVRATVSPQGEIAIAGLAGGAMMIGTESVGPGLYVAKVGVDGEIAWARGFSGTQPYPNSVAIAPNGDVVVVGRLDGTLSFGASSLISSGSDGFILKLASANGTVLQAKLIGGSSGSTFEEWDGLNAVTVDAAGNVYATGHFAGTGAPCTNTQISDGYFDVFVARFRASDLMCEWDRVFGGDTSDAGHAIATDGVGVFVGASVSGSVDAGGGVFPATAVNDIVVARYAASGGFHSWSLRFPSGLIKGMAAGDGGVFFGGLVNGQASFGGGQVGTAGADDVFFVRLSGGNGAHSWSKSFAGGASLDTYNSLTVAGNALHYAGAFTGQGGFGGTALNGPGGVVASYDLATGTHTASTLIGADAVLGVPTPHGRVTVGTFSGITTLGGQQGTSAGARDVFILRE